MRIKEILNKKYKFKSDNPLPLLDIQVILSDAISKDRSFIIAHDEYELTRSELGLFNKNIKRRLQSEPVAYILGKKEFYGYEFEVNKDVLIPRPETEELIDKALEVIRNSNRNDVFRILDIGTGSGCIPISILLETSKKSPGNRIEIWAIDISDNALAVAKNNYHTYQDRIRNSRVKFIKCDVFSKETLSQAFGDTKFDLILSNPPYIPSDEIETLMPDVRDFEPIIALDGGAYGNDFYNAIKKNLVNNVSTGTVFIFEKYNGIIEKI